MKDAKKAAKQLAIEGSSYCFQTDQQAVKLLPKVEAGMSYYKQKLQVHNYTIYELATQKAHNFWFSEDQRNLEASTFASILIAFLEQTCIEKKSVFLVSDGCGYQNRNAVLSNALLRFATKKKVKILKIYLNLKLKF